MKRLFLFTLCFAWSFLAFSTDWTVKTIPDPKSAPSKIFLTDPDDLINAASEESINHICWEIEEKIGVQFGIVVVNSIGSEVPKQFANELFNYWGIGKGGKDNGLLLLVVINQRRYEFESGYGMEGDLPDWALKQIGTYNLVPYMKLQDYSGGIVNTTLAVRNHLYEKYQVESADSDTMYQNYQPTLPNIIHEDVSQLESSDEIMAGYNDYFMNQTSGGDIAIFVLQNYWWAYALFILFIVIWWVAAKKNSKNKPNKKEKRSTPDQPMNKTIFWLSASLPFLLWIVYCIQPFFVPGNYFGYLMLSVYLSIFILMTSYRVRVNRKILNTDYDLYLKWSDFTESNKLWVVLATLFFPIFYIPYTIWFFSMRSKLRKAPRPCKKCQQTLNYKDNVVSEDADDKHLSKGQLKEEYLTSRDWDVWECKSCSQVEVLGYKKLFTAYDTCPSCKFITEKYEGSVTVVAATYSSSGTGKKKYRCLNCNNYREVTYTIPMKTRSSSSSSSGGSSWSSGGGGGSSWGGGRSGGGGAGGSW